MLGTPCFNYILWKICFFLQSNPVLMTSPSLSLFHSQQPQWWKTYPLTSFLCIMTALFSPLTKHREVILITSKGNFLQFSSLVAWRKDCHNTVNMVTSIYLGTVPVDPRMQGMLCKTYIPAKTLKAANFKWMIVESVKNWTHHAKL